MKSSNNEKTSRKTSTYDLDALRQEWRIQMYRIAATEYAQIEADKLAKEIDADVAAGKTQALDAHCARKERKTLQIIHRAVRREQVKRIAKQTLPQIGKMAAAAALVFAIGLPMAIAASHTVRVRMMEFLVKIEAQYTELSIREDMERSFDLPAEWGGSYYPSKIPAGFVVTNLINGAASSSVDLGLPDENGINICFSEHREGSFANLDTENSALSTAIIHGSLALVAQKNAKVSVAWSRDSVYFMLTCYGLTEQQTLELASSVVRVKK